MARPDDLTDASRNRSKSLWTENRYLVDAAGAPERALAEAERVFEAVWRYDFTEPGFCLIELGAGLHSRTLRGVMLDLKARLSEIAIQRGGTRFVYGSLGRFDQQETTRFHLDGAPDQSLLVLGYEPSQVRSRLALADFTRCAHDLGIEPSRFLGEFNPMYRKGEETLVPYVTELPQRRPGHSRILLINNSRLPFSESRTNALGVMHKAEILTPDDRERRIVNSMMLATSGAELVDLDQLRAFAASDEVSKKFYDSPARESV